MGFKTAFVNLVTPSITNPNPRSYGGRVLLENTQHFPDIGIIENEMFATTEDQIAYNEALDEVEAAKNEFDDEDNDFHDVVFDRQELYDYVNDYLGVYARGDTSDSSVSEQSEDEDEPEENHDLTTRQVEIIRNNRAEGRSQEVLEQRRKDQMLRAKQLKREQLHTRRNQEYLLQTSAPVEGSSTGDDTEQLRQIRRHQKLLAKEMKKSKKHDKRERLLQDKRQRKAKRKQQRQRRQQSSSELDALSQHSRDEQPNEEALVQRKEQRQQKKRLRRERREARRVERNRHKREREERQLREREERQQKEREERQQREREERQQREREERQQREREVQQRNRERRLQRRERREEREDSESHSVEQRNRDNTWDRSGRQRSRSRPRQRRRNTNSNGDNSAAGNEILESGSVHTSSGNSRGSGRARDRSRTRIRNRDVANANHRFRRNYNNFGHSQEELPAYREHFHKYLDLMSFDSRFSPVLRINKSLIKNEIELNKLIGQFKELNVFPESIDPFNLSHIDERHFDDLIPELISDNSNNSSPMPHPSSSDSAIPLDNLDERRSSRIFNNLILHDVNNYENPNWAASDENIQLALQLSLMDQEQQSLASLLNPPPFYSISHHASPFNSSSSFTSIARTETSTPSSSSIQITGNLSSYSPRVQLPNVA